MNEENNKRTYDTFEKKKIVVKERTNSFHIMIFIIAIILFVFSVYKYGEKMNHERYFIRVPSTVYKIEEKRDRYQLSYVYYIKKEPYMIDMPFTTSFKVPLDTEKTVAYNIENPREVVFKYSNYYSYLIVFSLLLIVLNIESIIKSKTKEEHKVYLNLIILSTIGLFIIGSLFAFYAFFFEEFKFNQLFVLIRPQMTALLIFGLISIGVLLISLMTLLIKKGLADE